MNDVHTLHFHEMGGDAIASVGEASITLVFEPQQKAVQQVKEASRLRHRGANKILAWDQLSSFPEIPLRIYASGCWRSLNFRKTNPANSPLCFRNPWEYDRQKFLVSRHVGQQYRGRKFRNKWNKRIGRRRRCLRSFQRLRRRMVVFPTSLLLRRDGHRSIRVDSRHPLRGFNPVDDKVVVLLLITVFRATLRQSRMWRRRWADGS